MMTGIPGDFSSFYDTVPCSARLCALMSWKNRSAIVAEAEMSQLSGINLTLMVAPQVTWVLLYAIAAYLVSEQFCM